MTNKQIKLKTSKTELLIVPPKRHLPADCPNATNAVPSFHSPEPKNLDSFLTTLYCMPYALCI